MDESIHAHIPRHGALKCGIGVGMKNRIPIRMMSLRILIGTMISLLGTNCSIGQWSVPPSTSEAQYTQTPTTNRVVTATGLPAPTLTATNAPTSLPTTTWTPLPTIESHEVGTFVESLHLRCALPCWGNMIPGETSESEAKHFLSSFGQVEKSSTAFDYDDRLVTIDLTFGDGVLTSLNLPPEITEFYRLHYLLTNFGVPADIQLRLIPQTAEGTSWFDLVLLYPRDGFFGIFGAQGKPVNSIINICPADVSPDLYLVASSTYSLTDMNRLVSVILGQGAGPLESLIGIDKDQFYELFREENSQCVATNVHTP